MPSDPSWVWRKLLNLGPLVQQHIKYLVGNGIAMSLWFDNWHPLGPFHWYKSLSLESFMILASPKIP